MTWKGLVAWSFASLIAFVSLAEVLERATRERLEHEIARTNLLSEWITEHEPATRFTRDGVPYQTTSLLEAGTHADGAGKIHGIPVIRDSFPYMDTAPYGIYAAMNAIPIFKCSECAAYFPDPDRIKPCPTCVTHTAHPR